MAMKHITNKKSINTSNSSSPLSFKCFNFEVDKMEQVKIENMHLISYGVFSNVYYGNIIEPIKKQVAIKNTWVEKKAAAGKNIIELDAVKELKVLSLLRKGNHKNIIMLLYCFRIVPKHGDKRCISMIFEYMPHNLHQIISKNKKPLPDFDIKMYIWQLFRAQAHLEMLYIAHRDIKPQNILVDPISGLLKLGDFGSAKIMEGGCRSISYNVTRYYRPPELLLGSQSYRSRIDIWSCGCVLGEMMKGNILLRGRSTKDQLRLIYECLGTPTSEDLVAMKIDEVDKINVDQTPDIVPAQINGDIKKRNNINPFKHLFPGGANRELLELLKEILVFNPEKRLSGPTLFKHKAFKELFERNVTRNGSPFTVLTKKDLQEAAEGDVACLQRTVESTTISLKLKSS
uniref:Protein kinase domain-containing protein n=1 Tax=Parastrongyloides trichosuri TaxID=131310 RepID=A0A0N4Z7L7_PARTI